MMERDPITEIPERCRTCPHLTSYIRALLAAENVIAAIDSNPEKIRDTWGISQELIDMLAKDAQRNKATATAELISQTARTRNCPGVKIITHPGKIVPNIPIEIECRSTEA